MVIYLHSILGYKLFFFIRRLVYCSIVINNERLPKHIIDKKQLCLLESQRSWHPVPCFNHRLNYYIIYAAYKD